MKNRTIKTVVFLGDAFFILTLAGMKDSMADEKKKNIFTMTDGPETTITVETMGEFSIKIKSNPTTGYSWAPQKITDKAVVKFKRVEEDFQENEEDKPPLLGAPTYEIFTFAALEQGKTAIFLIYRRPWEKNTAPLKTHNVHVTVK